MIWYRRCWLADNHTLCILFACDRSLTDCVALCSRAGESTCWCRKGTGIVSGQQTQEIQVFRQRGSGRTGR